MISTRILDSSYFAGNLVYPTKSFFFSRTVVTSCTIKLNRETLICQHHIAYRTLNSQYHPNEKWKKLQSNGKGLPKINIDVNTISRSFQLQAFTRFLFFNRFDSKNDDVVSTDSTLPGITIAPAKSCELLLKHCTINIFYMYSLQIFNENFNLKFLNISFQTFLIVRSLFEISDQSKCNNNHSHILIYHKTVCMFTFYVQHLICSNVSTRSIKFLIDMLHTFKQAYFT